MKWNWYTIQHIDDYMKSNIWYCDNTTLFINSDNFGPVITQIISILSSNPGIHIFLVWSIKYVLLLYTATPRHTWPVLCFHQHYDNERIVAC